MPKKKQSTVELAQEHKLTIQYRNIDELVPYENNPRVHSESQIQTIVNSIKRFGFTNPVLLDGSNGVIAGHGRLAACRLLSMESVPCIDLSHLTDDEKRAYIIADNAIALGSEWSPELLRVELQKLEEVDFDMSLLGFQPQELQEFMAPDPNEGLTDPDAVPETPTTPVTVMGDVWRCGESRVMCGDSTVITDVEKLMAGQKADMIFTDPPYGVDFEQGKYCPTAGKNFRGTKIANDEMKGTDLSNFIRDALVCGLQCSKHIPVYVWAPPLLPGVAVHEGVRSAGIHVQSKIIWRKHTFVLGRADYHWQHEECYYGYVGDKHPWYGGRDKGTVWDVNKLQKVELHPTQKPVELAEIAINNSSKGGDIVLDLFGGSGMTLIAAEKLGRCAYLMELSPFFVDVITRRWCEYTGNDAIRESDGATWSQVNGYE